VKPLISVITFVGCIGLVLIAGYWWPADPKLWPGDKQTILYPDPQYLPGVEGPGRFSTNALGIRVAPEVCTHQEPHCFTWPNERLVLAIGGSTTESLYLDDTETWPHLLMTSLDNTWVGNVGQSGRTTVDHLTLLQTVPYFGVGTVVDQWIFLIGVNDFQTSLAHWGASTESALQESTRVFEQRLRNGGVDSRGLIKLPFGYRWGRGFGEPLGMGSGLWHEELRRRRREATILSMPDLSAGLQEYKARVTRLHEFCEEVGVQCLFLTQPSLWRNDLTPEEERWLWLGWVGPIHTAEGYIATAELSAGMSAYNRTLLELCHDRNMECFDLAAVIPKSMDYFYDGVHFNEAGSRLVAKELSALLR